MTVDETEIEKYEMWKDGLVDYINLFREMDLDILCLTEHIDELELKTKEKVVECPEEFNTKIDNMRTKIGLLLLTLKVLKQEQPQT